MIPLSYRPGGNMNILLISLPEKNKDMKLEATEVLPLALYSLSSVLKCQLLQFNRKTGNILIRPTSL